MKKSDLIINLADMRKSGEFDPDIVFSNLGITYGKVIAMPIINCAIYLDCSYKKDRLPPFIQPYRFDSQTFWG